MNNSIIRFLLNPFERIAGFQALSWGILGLLVSTALAYPTGYHYHGLLHYGPASNPAWWCFAAEHLIVWIVPALLFYIGGIVLSRSKIRILDVFGTVLFAQIPLLFTNLISFLPIYKQMSTIDTSASLQDQITQANNLILQPGFWLGIWFSLVLVVFVIWMGYWLLKALAVSCNLKGKNLVILFCIGLFGGDFICRLIINLLY
jgi:hypothetical protein